MESLLETQRRCHEERERLIDTMTREMLHEKNTYKERVNSDHRLKLLLDRYVDSSQRLKDVYEDRDNSRRKEMQAISGPNEFAEFYGRIKSLKDT
uniref:Splicing factor SF3a60 binding domain-containing protein n=1 Tax=Romanomermis culicivorax TaxID=13658 RepID=A0A915KWL8_ROMCU